MITTYYLFLYLQFLDGVTTYVAIQTGAFGEANPIARMFMAYLGVGLGLTVFKSICSLSGLLIYKYFGKIPNLVNWLGAGVVVWNLILLTLF